MISVTVLHDFIVPFTFIFILDRKNVLLLLLLFEMLFTN